MRTGVYGGTFNPIHRGHVHILGEFARRLGLGRVLLIPTGIPPHKRPQSLASSARRVEMCRLAAQELPEIQVVVSRIELERPGKSFTSVTLSQLSGLYPADDFFLLMGEDMFLTVDNWHNAATIFRLASLCASPRSQAGLERLRAKKRELEALGARCFVEDIPFWDVSSTMVRELAAKQKPLKGLVPEKVAEYIEKNGIYREAQNNDL